MNLASSIFVFEKKKKKSERVKKRREIDVTLLTLFFKYLQEKLLDNR